MEHIPVLIDDVQKYLNLKPCQIYIDATLGLGGHSLILLKQIGKTGKLIAFEQDERNLNEARRRLKDYENQIIYIHNNFRYLKSRVTGLGINKVDGIFFDLGLSSPHVEDSERGFSFIKDGPLDMRFDQRDQLTAADVVNTYKEEDLSRIFFEYGEERMARKIAREICSRRHDKIFSSTVELSEFIGQIIGKRKEYKFKNPSTKIFQALRIEVNDELNALKEALEQAFDFLKSNGRLVVISYHSLEDRIVKQFFKNLERPEAKEEERIYSNFGDPLIKILTKKPVCPTEKEIEKNPRSRSAKLRAFEKI